MIKEQESYFVEYNKINGIISKIYPLNCEVRKNKNQLVIVFIYDKYTFLSNDGLCFGWQKDRDIFLQSKSKSKKIMIF